MKVDGFFDQLSGVRGEGYEIHMGKSSVSAEAYLLIAFEEEHAGKTDGMALENCAGTYMHGIFDSGDFSGKLVDLLLEAKGLDPKKRTFDLHAYKQGQYDLLASVLRKSLDLDRIYRILEQGI